MAAKPVRLGVGDRVCVRGARQRMLITDMEGAASHNVTCAWRDRRGLHEHLYTRAALILLRRARA